MLFSKRLLDIQRSLRNNIQFPCGDQEISFDQLAVGQEVLAWTTGSMAASAPGLASAVKIQIK